MNKEENIFLLFSIIGCPLMIALRNIYNNSHITRLLWFIKCEPYMYTYSSICVNDAFLSYINNAVGVVFLVMYTSSSSLEQRTTLVVTRWLYQPGTDLQKHFKVYF